MDLKLNGKRAVVTGGTAGIGFAVATALAEEGAQVYITGRTKESVEKAVREISEQSKPAHPVVGVIADLGQAEGAQALLQQVPDADILVNNLGIYEAKPFAEITDEEWLHLFEVNVLSGVRATRGYLPKMFAKNWGRVIFIASESAVMVPSDMIHYGMTKTAQLSIARGLAETTKGTGVTINTVLPGPTKSANIVDFMRSVSSEPKTSDSEIEAEFFEKHRPSSLLQRLIEAKEVANLVAYLASPLSSATTGAALRVEGGLLRSIV